MDAQMVWAGPGPARQAGVFGVHPASRCRRRAAAVAGSSSTDRWEAESSSTARCQLSITLVLGIEHGEAEREAAARRPDYIQLASQGDARPWPLVLPLLRIQAGWQNVLVLVLVPVCWRWCLGCTKHPRVTQSRCRPFAQSVPVEAEALAQRRGKQASKAL